MKELELFLLHSLLYGITQSFAPRRSKDLSSSTQVRPIRSAPHTVKKCRGLCCPLHWNIAGDTSLIYGSTGIATRSNPSGHLIWCFSQERDQHHLTWKKRQENLMVLLQRLALVWDHEGWQLLNATLLVIVTPSCFSSPYGSGFFQNDNKASQW